MKISQFINPLLKWSWLIILSILIAGGTSYWIVRSLPPVYLAHTTLMVGQAISDPNPSGNEFGTTQQLAIYYTNIAMREPIRDGTEEALGLEELPKYDAVAVPYSPFIEISVTDTNPNRAMAVANELARQIILQSPTAPKQDDIERLAFLNDQLNQVQQSIIDTQSEIDQKQIELTLITSATQIEDTQAEITALESKLTLLQNNYTEMLANTQSGAINTLNIVEVAILPVKPIGPKKPLIIGVAAVAGMVLAVSIAYLLEFIDRTIKHPEDVEQTLHTPILGSIHKMSKKNPLGTFFAKEPRSPFSEAFRILRTNLGFISVENPLRTLAVSSVNEGEGKTTIAVNLSLAYAQSNKKVILIDADLRRPAVHKTLQVPAQPGLSNAFTEDTNLEDLLRQCELSEHLQILPAGKIPPNPAELLNSSKMNEIIENLISKADILIIDGPPMIIPDAAILASKVDGVLMVIQSGIVRFEIATKVHTQIQRAGGKLIGVVLNHAKKLDSMLHTGYKYYDYQFDDNLENTDSDKKRLSFPSLRRKNKSSSTGKTPTEKTESI